MAWILVGICICSIFTATLTTSLTTISLDTKKSLPGSKVVIYFAHMIGIIKPFLLTQFRRARSRNFRQFQHRLNGYRIYYFIKIMVQNYRRTQIKHRKAKKRHGWTNLERIKMDCICFNLKNVGPPFFKFTSVYIKISITQLKKTQNSFSVVMWP